MLAYIALVCSSPRQRSRLFVPAFLVPTICKLYVYALQISICSAKSYAGRCDEPVAGKTAALALAGKAAAEAEADVSPGVARFATSYDSFRRRERTAW